ncbi:MAG TPA: serine hydroxymethyltransferase, partial [Thermomicrobiales bacterium]|nr:serine hydroxymethyltransferase [Thermomicrobiales bacterium]
LGISGRKAEKALDAVGITVNKNTIPGDTRPPTQASGIRIGTPALTTRGFNEDDMRQIGRTIASVLHNLDDDRIAGEARGVVQGLTERYPVPGIDESDL